MNDLLNITYPFKEYWYPIVRLDGLYMVSNWGRIKNSRTSVILKPYIDGNGYYQVNIWFKKKRMHLKIHREVGKAFIPNPYNLSQLNHLSEIKTENWVELDDDGNILDSNLEWCNAKYNTNFGTAIKRRALKQLNLPSKSRPVLQFSKDGVLINTYPSIMEAERQTGIYKRDIGNCCRNKVYTDKDGNVHRVLSAKGYIWRYA